LRDHKKGWQNIDLNSLMRFLIKKWHHINQINILLKITQDSILKGYDFYHEVHKEEHEMFPRKILYITTTITKQFYKIAFSGFFVWIVFLIVICFVSASNSNQNL